MTDRKQHVFEIDDPKSRDDGKRFIITEMLAMDGEQLAEDIFRIMGEKKFVEIPADVISMGCAGLANYGLAVISAADPAASREIKSRLLATVEVEEGRAGHSVKRKLYPDSDFSEITTIRQLVDRVFSVNFDFFTLSDESNTPS